MDVVVVVVQFSEFCLDIVMYLVVESYVDCFIDGLVVFIQINVIGIFILLEVVCYYWFGFGEVQKQVFCFYYIFIDEVYGDLYGIDDLFIEEILYVLSSLYFVFKVGSDYLVCVWNCIYGLLVVVINCFNNYGLYYFLEKLILLIIFNVLVGKLLLVYGNGEQICDWLYVEDYVCVLYKVVIEGKSGEIYNIGGYNECKNIDVVCIICVIFDKVVVQKLGNIIYFVDLIIFVIDCLGYDLCYVIDVVKIQCDLGWVLQEMFESGIEKIVYWYLNNQIWWQCVLDGFYVGECFGFNN